MGLIGLIMMLGGWGLYFLAGNLLVGQLAVFGDILLVLAIVFMVIGGFSAVVSSVYFYCLQ